MCRSGIVGDDALAGLAAAADGGVHVRLILGKIGPTCHCCVGAPADLVAVLPTDPSLPAGLGQALLHNGEGAAVATQEADHLGGSALVTESASFPIVRSGIGGDPTIVVRFSDAGTFLSQNPDLVTVAVFKHRPDVEVPDNWDSGPGARDQTFGTVGGAGPTALGWSFDG